MSSPVDAGVVVVGTGPAGVGLLTAALARGQLGDLLDHGLIVLDDGPIGRAGAGALADYTVRSDTRGRVFVECVRPVVDALPTAGDVRTGPCLTDEPVPLSTASALLAAAARPLLDHIGRQPGGIVLHDTRVTSIRHRRSGLELTAGAHLLRARRVVLAVGGRPWVPPALAARVRAAAVRAAAVRPERLVHSDSILRGALPELHAGTRVLVVGVAHSAFSVARVLLDTGVDWPDGGIVIAGRRPPRMTYPDWAAAHLDGVAVGPHDVCPRTGLVHRFGGLRSDSADLLRAARSGVERRIRLAAYAPSMVDRADLVIAATGYVSAAPALFDDLPAPTPTRPLWDPAGRLLPGVHGLGLGTWRRRTERTGGEPSFGGAIDGTWFYQNVVAPDLLTVLRTPAALSRR